MWRRLSGLRWLQTIVVCAIMLVIVGELDQNAAFTILRRSVGYGIDFYAKLRPVPCSAGENIIVFTPTPCVELALSLHGWPKESVRNFEAVADDDCPRTDYKWSKLCVFNSQVRKVIWRVIAGRNCHPACIIQTPARPSLSAVFPADGEKERAFIVGLVRSNKFIMAWKNESALCRDKRSLSIASLAPREITEDASGQNQAHRRSKQGRSPSDEPSVGSALLLAILGFLGTFCCGLRGGYHLYEKRSVCGALWLTGGACWGALSIIIILSAF